jgi:hypothetical protein
MNNQQIMARALKGWKKVITTLQNSGDTTDDMRSALQKSAQIVRDEIEGNKELGQDLLIILPGLNDSQIREIYRKWIGDAHKAAESLTDLSKQLGYSIDSDSKCFIATAACGEGSEEVTTLRLFRDHHLQTSFGGRVFIWLYYRFSPPVAELIHASPSSCSYVRKMLIRPVSRLLKRLFCLIT